MRFQTAVLCLLALAPCTTAQNLATLPANCVDINTKVGARFNSGNLAGAEAALSEFLAGGSGSSDARCAGLALHNLAVVSSSAGRLGEAEALEDRAIKILKLGRDATDTALLRPLLVLWSVRFQQEKFGPAREAFRALLSIPLRMAQDRAMVSGAAAQQLFLEGRYEDAEREFQNALREWDNAGGGATPYASSVLTGLGSLYVVQGRYQDAERTLQRAFENGGSRNGTLPTDRMNIFVVRASLRAREGKWREAEDDLSAAIAIAEREMALDPARVRPLLLGHAFVLRKMHRSKQARLDEDRAKSIATSALAGGLVDITQLTDNSKRSK